MKLPHLLPKVNFKQVGVTSSPQIDKQSFVSFVIESVVLTLKSTEGQLNYWPCEGCKILYPSYIHIMTALGEVLSGCKV